MAVLGLTPIKSQRTALQTARPFFHLISILQWHVRAAAAQEQARLFTEGAGLEGVDLTALITACSSTQEKPLLMLPLDKKKHNYNIK